MKNLQRFEVWQVCAGLIKSCTCGSPLTATYKLYAIHLTGKEQKMAAT